MTGIGIDGADAAERFDAVHAGHLDVEEHERGPPAPHGGQGAGAVGGGLHRVAARAVRVLEEGREHLADRVLVVHDQDGLRRPVAHAGHHTTDAEAWRVPSQSQWMKSDRTRAGDT